MITDANALLALKAILFVGGSGLLLMAIDYFRSSFDTLFEDENMENRITGVAFLAAGLFLYSMCFFDLSFLTKA